MLCEIQLMNLVSLKAKLVATNSEKDFQGEVI